MNHKITISAVVGAIAILVATEWPSNNETQHSADTNHFLPWQIEHTAEGATLVFGLILGRSTLAEAEHRFAAESEVSLFVAPNGKLVVEGYFDGVNLAGLGARVIVVVDTPAKTEIYNRGARISTLGDGTHKVSLSTEDLIQIRHQPITSLTYLPKVKLDPALIESRFGKPQIQIREPKQDTNHWLYPEQGLDIALGVGPPVFQYVAPRDFSLLSTPLIQQGERLP
ncbi:conserved hypothetical protein [Gammaproteobacteria bacterium]